MGLFSSSSKSTSTTNQYDNRVGASEEGFAIGHESNVSIDNTTPEAFTFAGGAFDRVVDLLAESQQNYTDTLKNFQAGNLEVLKTADTFTRDNATKLSEIIGGNIPMIIFIVAAGFVLIKWVK